MSVINHTITEEELQDIKNALTAIETEQVANDITYGVFRNVIDPESVRRWIVQKSKRFFIVPVEKGHGLV